MRDWSVLGLAMILGGLASCDPPAQVGAGAACNSLSDCKPGLTCIEGACDEDLSTIAGQVPVYADAAVATGGTGGTGGGATGGATPPDAGAADR